MEYIIDPELEPDADLFLDAVSIPHDIRRFWTSIEKDIGTFEDHGDVDLDDVVPLSLMILQTCIAAYVCGGAGRGGGGRLRIARGRMTPNGSAPDHGAGLADRGPTRGSRPRGRTRIATP